MTARATFRRGQFELNRQALLRAILGRSDQQQLRERARMLAAHGNTDAIIAAELGQSVDQVRRWLSR